ncbi:MAG TPA: HD domain-containing protein [Novimethylophilus sp.]|jgi:(p)ppGpp synthase/HD superfamily hydrolase|uniref:HD domain-containing protein n=1 Tax=Novimethylophilus sp. TaxID=2137426 RepID=UPI002F42EC9C
MVSASALLASGVDDVSSWLESLKQRFPPAEIEVIRRACDLAAPLYAGHAELTGAPLMQHALGAASILIGMNMDVETIAATILPAVPDDLDDWRATLETRFGAGIAGLVEGISRMEQIQEFSEIECLHDPDRKNGDHAQQIESLRKMLLAMVQDIRVVLIKLAERTQTMRRLSGAVNQEKTRRNCTSRNLEDLLAAIGRGDVSEHQIALAIQEEAAPKPEEAAKPFAPRHTIAPPSPIGIMVEGVGNLLTSMAKCCKPAPPDAIVGYVTRDRGASTVWPAPSSPACHRTGATACSTPSGAAWTSARRSTSKWKPTTARACCATSATCSSGKRSTPPRPIP